MLNRNRLLGFFTLFLLGWVSSTQAGKCGPEPVNPITDIAWQCVFPIRVGGLLQVGTGAPEDPDNIDSPACVCSNGTLPKIGVSFSFWEPARMIDTVTDPYCFLAMGVKLANPTPGRLGGDLGRDNQGGKAFAQMHYYIFPVWALLDMFTDLPCLKDKSFDIAFITEVLPTWNNELLALILNPEALLFANPAAALACAADSLSALVGQPRNELFWCMGTWGNAYPLAGSITATDYVEANAGLAARGIYLMGRTGLLMDPGENACYQIRTPIWRKRHYRLQEAKPVRDSSCQPIGRSGMTWTQFKNPALAGDNFAWMVFRKTKCCVTY